VDGRLVGADRGLAGAVASEERAFVVELALGEEVEVLAVELAAIRPAFRIEQIEVRRLLLPRSVRGSIDIS
jgi:hypothetical protein